jgi:uncharacterized Fe-S center protein
MKEKVFLIKIQDGEADSSVCDKLQKAIEDNDLLSFINPKDKVALKTHFGEENTNGFIRPLYFNMLGEKVKAKQGLPFLTETSTLYVGKRSNAVEHIQHAYNHGFTFEATGLPIIMADGLMGDEEIEVEIPKGQLYKKVGIASLILRTQAMVMVSHFTGHMITGFGGALKNMGMGCASRRGKLIQHSTAKPNIKKAKCTGCGECLKWCAVQAISLVEKKAKIDKNKCIGCGECLAVCRFDAVGFNWFETYENVQKKVVEHAMGVAEPKKGKIIYINFLNRITKDCDCMGKYQKIMPDIGVLISYDPVAIDAASIDLVVEGSDDNWKNLSYDVPYRIQVDYSREIGFGNPDYELIELNL